MTCTALYTQSQRFLATLLLFSFLLESCYNPNIGVGKKSISQPQEASGGNTSPEEDPYDNSREQRTATTTDNRPIETSQAASDTEQAQEQPAQQGAQAKGKERAASIVEVSEEPAQPGPAIIPQPPSLADRSPQHTASQVFLAQVGQPGGGTGEPAGRDQHQGETSTGKVQGPQGSVLNHDLPIALELTESKGPTELEKAQQEAAGLKEKIAKLYSTFPQATEKADEKVVDELITHLKALSKLEDFWAPAQGSDGAKEYIDRLKKTDRTKWGQTAYGASISKQLTALLVKAWGQKLGLKQLASDKTPAGVERLVQVLDRLAAFDLEQGVQTGDLSYYTDAAILYQNILRICEERKDYQEQIEAAYMGLAKIRRAMLASGKGGKAGVVAQGDLGIAKLQGEIARDKQVLQDLRADAKKRVAQLEALLSKQGSQEEELTYEKEYIAGSRALFSDIAEQVKEFLARLYQESAQELSAVLGPPPCKYTVIGLGSMALAQMTPYSDLEFAILMEEGTDEAREYLRQLTHLVHFRVINLEETVIPEYKYEIDLDHLGKKGIRFDLGGKTPLGREDKPYDLIQPVVGMLRYLRNERDSIEHIDKNLPYILESACYVHGDKELYNVYTAEKKAFLRQEQIHKTRALRMLQEGVSEWDYGSPGIAKAKPRQQGILAAFKPKFNIEDAGRLYDVKQEIYRLPDRLLYGLSMYYGLVPQSGWDAVDQLSESGIIGVGASALEAVHHLQYAVSFATLLRLKTYLHHDQQREGVTMLSGVRQEETQQAVSKAFLLPKEALQAGGSLFKYYYTALALHSKMESFFESSEGNAPPSNERGFFQEEPFYDASDATRGAIYRRLLQYKQAKACYERTLAIYEKVYGAEHPKVATSLNNLGLVWQDLGDPKKAIEYHEGSLAIYEKVYNEEHPKVAASLNNLGSAWNDLGDPRQAIEYYERALAIDEKVYEAEHPYVATSLNNLGNAWNEAGDPKQAIKCCERALDISNKVYGPGHPAVARNLNNLGTAWNKLGDPKKAIDYYERSLEIRKKAYREEHPYVATSLNNLGSAWSGLGDPKKAIEYYERSLAIYEKVYRAEHPKVATVLNNLGNTWHQLGNPKKAIEYYERSLEIRKKVYGKGHPDVAMSLNNLGLVWQDLGDPKKAIEYYERSLEIRKKAYREEHPYVATSLNNLGNAWNDLGDPKKAMGCYKQALAIDEQVYGSEHPRVAEGLNNMGLAWYQLGDPKKAIEYYERSLAIYEKVYNEEHPKVATILNKLGLAWNDLGDPKKAIEYYERSLATYEKVYNEEHPEVATILNKLGLAWNDLGDPKKAIEYYERSLAIYEKVYGAGHPEVATILNNLGSAWDELGDPRQAIEYYERASAIEEKVYGSEHPNVSTILNNLGGAWDELGDPRQAIEYYERALAIEKKVYGAEYPEVAMKLNSLGSAWDKLGDPKKAIEYYERALDIYKKVYGEQHPEVATRLHDLGLAWNELGDPKKAIGYLERALAIIEKVYDPEHPEVAASLTNLGLACYELGDPKQAIECYERALPIDEKIYGAEHPHVAANLANLGRAWDKLGDHKKVIGYLERALAIIEKVYDPEHPDVATILNSLGSVWDQLGDPKQAIEYHKQALEIRKKVYGEEHPEVATSLNNLGTAWDDLGDSKKAIEYYERAFHIMKKVYGEDHPSTQEIKHNMKQHG